MQNIFTKKISYKRGFSLVEALVGSAIALASIFVLTSSFSFYLRAEFENVSQIQAAFLAEEGQEAIRSMRDSGWTSQIAPLSTSVPFFLSWTGSSWTTSSTYTLIDNQFERKVAISQVYRNASDDIATSGTLDPNTRKVVVSVAWRGPQGTTTRSISAYVTNLFSN